MSYLYKLFNRSLVKVLKPLGLTLETEEEALEAGTSILRQGNEYSPTPIYNYIGEGKDVIDHAYREYVHLFYLLDNSAQSSSRYSISIKPSQFKNRTTIMEVVIGVIVTYTPYSPSRGIDLWIDAEEYSRSDEQLKLAHWLMNKSSPFRRYCKIGLTVQLKSDNYLRDIETCFENNILVRLCKGAYPSNTPCSVNDRLANVFSYFGDEIRESGLLELATIRDTSWVFLARVHNLYLQTLYGWHRKFLDYPKVRVYIPYGIYWWPYIKRRIQERAHLT